VMHQRKNAAFVGITTSPSGAPIASLEEKPCDRASTDSPDGATEAGASRHADRPSASVGDHEPRHADGPAARSHASKPGDRIASGGELAGYRLAEAARAESRFRRPSPWRSHLALVRATPGVKTSSRRVMATPPTPS